MKTFTTHLPKSHSEFLNSTHMFQWNIHGEHESDTNHSLITIQIEEPFGISGMDSVITTRLNDDGTISPKAGNIEMCIAVPHGEHPDDVSYEIDIDVAARQLKKIVIPAVEKLFPLVSA